MESTTYRSSSVHPDRFPHFLRQAGWYVLFLQSARDWVVSVLVWFLLFGPKHNYSLHDGHEREETFLAVALFQSNFCATVDFFLPVFFSWEPSFPYPSCVAQLFFDTGREGITHRTARMAHTSAVQGEQQNGQSCAVSTLHDHFLELEKKTPRVTLTLTHQHHVPPIHHLTASITFKPARHDKMTMTTTMTMTHSEKSIKLSLVAWPYRQERRGHDPTKKSLLKLVWLALLASFALTGDDSVQYIGSQGEARGKRKTQAVAGINSLHSSRWNPRILCNATKGQGESRT